MMGMPNIKNSSLVRIRPKATLISGQQNSGKKINDKVNLTRDHCHNSHHTREVLEVTWKASRKGQREQIS